MKTFKLIVSRDADFMELSSGGHQAKQDIATKPEVWEYVLNERQQVKIAVQEDLVEDALDHDESAAESSFENHEANVSVTPRRLERITREFLHLVIKKSKTR